jgi:hypothetical protein
MLYIMQQRRGKARFREKLLHFLQHHSTVNMDPSHLLQNRLVLD